MKFNLFGLFRGQTGEDAPKPAAPSTERVWVSAEKWTAIQDETAEEERRAKARARLGIAFYERNPDMSKHDRSDATYAIVEAGCDINEAVKMIREGASADEVLNKLKKNKIGSAEVGRSPSP